jgi:hypothetical protein
VIKEVAAMRTATTYDGTQTVMNLLRSGVPLALLLDLAEPLGPRSAELYAAELVAA